MNRRNFLLCSAAALVAAPAAAEAGWTIAKHMTTTTPFLGEGWYVTGYDGEVFHRRIHDEHIYVTDFSTDQALIDYRKRRDEQIAAFAGIWGTVGQ